MSLKGQILKGRCNGKPFFFLNTTKTLLRRCINIVVHYFWSYLSLATKKHHPFQPKTKDCIFTSCHGCGLNDAAGVGTHCLMDCVYSVDSSDIILPQKTAANVQEVQNYPMDHPSSLMIEVSLKECTHSTLTKL